MLKILKKNKNKNTLKDTIFKFYAKNVNEWIA